MKETTFGHPLLIEETPLVIIPSLAVAIGLVEAIVLQQIHYLLRYPENGRVISGRRWIYNTYEQWIERYFPFLTVDVLKKCMLKLEKMSLLVSCQPEGGISRRKYYRLNDGMLARLRSGKVEIPHGATLHHRDAEAHVPLSETPCKEEKLRACPNAKNRPTEGEFDDFVETEQLDRVANRETYSELEAKKWRHWNKEKERWVKIYDWKAYIRNLNTCIANASKKPRETERARG